MSHSPEAYKDLLETLLHYVGHLPSDQLPVGIQVVVDRARELLEPGEFETRWVWDYDTEPEVPVPVRARKSAQGYYVDVDGNRYRDSWSTALEIIDHEIARVEDSLVDLGHHRDYIRELAEKYRSTAS